MKTNRILKTAAFISILAFAGNFAFAKGKADKKKTVNLDLSNAPDWVTGTPAAYPKAYYITGLGNAATDSASEDMAKGEVLQILSLNINSSTSYSVNATESSDSQNYDANINASSAISNLTGIKIAKKYSANDGSVYSLAVLDRQETADYYADLLHDIEKKVQENVDLAKNSEYYIDSIGYISSALKLAEDNEKNLFIIDAVGAMKKPDVSLSYGSVENVKGIAQNLAGKIIVSINVENDSNNNILNAFSDCFTSLGMKVSDTNPNYILNATISFDEVETPDTKHSYVMYTLRSSLKEKNASKEILTYNNNDRAGHLTFTNAKKKAILMAQKDVMKNFSELLKNKTKGISVK